MSLAVQAVAAVAAAGAVVSLWRGARVHAGALRRAYHWLGVAALLWAAGLILDEALPAPVGAAAIPLSFADVPALLALPALAAGLAGLGLTGPAEAMPRRAWRPAGPGRCRLTACLADGYVLASALFLVGWVVFFDSAFAAANSGPVTFAVELAHPLADLVALGATLPLAGGAGRRGLAPYLALASMTLSDCLAVGGRVAGARPGALALVSALAGFVLLGLAPWRPAARAGSHHSRRSADEASGRTGPAVTTVAAATAAGVAALVIGGQALAGGDLPRPVVLAVAATTVLALALRVVGLVRRERSASRAWQDSSWQFRHLADRTSDVVLLCDMRGSILYASRAVAGYGYAPEGLAGTPLAGLVHPEDLAGGRRVLREVIADPAGPPGRVPCRVRAADGTWRHVESTLSRYLDPGEPDRLLVTARDVSAQVALRRQVNHLTFHDGLTGLPNRTYVEQRAREAGAPDGAGVAGVIFLDLDGFRAVNEIVGHSAGDLLLTQVAHRLRALVPPRDIVARWGGDEFAVLVEGPVAGEEIVEMARRVAQAVATPPVRVGERNLGLTASVGVALSVDGPAGYAWRNADLAMSRAKDAGGGRVEVFTPPGTDKDARPVGPGASPPGQAPGSPAAAGAAEAGATVGGHRTGD